MPVNRYYSNTAVETTLSSGINNSVTSMVVASVSGFPASYPYTLVIDEGEATEELVEVTAAVGTTLTVVRGRDNTSASTHSAGAAVKHVVSAQDYREPQEHIAEQTTAHGLTLADVVLVDSPDVLTNKTLDLTDNTVTGTKTEFNAAVSDGDLLFDGDAPKGTLGYEQVTVPQNGIGSLTDLVDLAVTVSVEDGRRIRVSANIPLRDAGSGSVSAIGCIREGSTTLQTFDVGNLGVSEFATAQPEVVLTPSSGSHTYKLSVSVGTNTVNLNAEATRPAFILVEDIGV